MKPFVANAREFFSPMKIAIGFAEFLCKKKTVLQGPFVGLQFLKESSFISYRPVLLGTYEKELWPEIDKAASLCDGAIIVGAAEGYYAVGMALLAREFKVVAFEMDSKGRALIERNAALNKVSERIKILGKCDKDSLNESLECFRMPLLLMDVEGAEAILLCNANHDLLARSIILVEIHDFVDRSIGDKIKKCLQSSHEITTILQSKRCKEDLPGALLLKGVLWRWYQTLISENRPEMMRWFCMTPREFIES